MARNYQSLRAVKRPEGALWLDTSNSRNNMKSVIALVTRRAGQYRVFGAAWGGPAAITGVEVRIDGGLWRPAAIDRRNSDFGWLLWSIAWNDAAPGHDTLVSRARNALGEVQPTREELLDQRVSNREDNSQWARTVILYRSPRSRFAMP